MNAMRETSLRLLRLPLIVLLVLLLAPLGLVGIAFVLVTTALRWLWEQTDWTPRPSVFAAMHADLRRRQANQTAHACNRTEDNTPG